MLFAIMSAVAVVATLTVTLAFFSHISDKAHGAEEQQEKEKNSTKEMAARHIQNMASIPINPPEYETNVNYMPPPAELARRHKMSR